MAKMRTRRASLNKARDPRLNGRDLRVYLLHLFGEGFQLGATYEQASLVGAVAGKRVGEPPRVIGLPAQERAARASDAMRRHVADEARQLLFGIPAQVAGEEAQLFGERAARDAFQADHGLRLVAAFHDGSILADREAQG